MVRAKIPTPATLMVISGLFACLAAQCLLNSALKVSSSLVLPPQPESEAKWDPRLFSVFTFGHLPAAVDSIWLNILADTNISHVPKGTHAHLYYDFDLITSVDAFSREAYTIGASLLAVIRDDIDGARALLMKGDDFRRHGLQEYSKELRERYWSKEWQIPFLLAYVDLYERGDIASAAEDFREAAKLPGAPIYLNFLVDRLNHPEGPYEVGIRVTNMMLATEENPEARENLLKKRQSLFVAHFLAKMNTVFAEFKAGPRASPREKWERFTRTQKVDLTDIWGGKIYFDETSGRIKTTTPHDRVFNLD